MHSLQPPKPHSPRHHQGPSLTETGSDCSACHVDPPAHAQPRPGPSSQSHALSSIYNDHHSRLASTPSLCAPSLPPGAALPVAGCCDAGMSAALCCDESSCADDPHLPPGPAATPHETHSSSSHAVAGQWWDSLMSTCEECVNQDYSIDPSDCLACGANASQPNPRSALASTSAQSVGEGWQTEEGCCPDWKGIIDECSEACFALGQAAWPNGGADDCPDCWSPGLTQSIAQQISPAPTPSSTSSPAHNAMSDLFRGLDAKTVQEILECCYCAPSASAEDPTWSPSAHFSHSACPTGPHEHTPLGFDPHSGSVTPSPAAASLFALANQSPAQQPKQFQLANPSFAALVGQFPAQAMAAPSFKCEWGPCNATFLGKDALARHVNLDHLGLGPAQTGFGFAPETAHLWEDCTAPKQDFDFGLPLGNISTQTNPIAAHQVIPAPNAEQPPNPLVVQQATSTLLKHLIDDHLAKLEPGLAHALGRELQASADAATRLAATGSTTKEVDLETLSASSTHTHQESEQPSPPIQPLHKPHIHHAHPHSRPHPHPHSHAHPHQHQHSHAGPHRHAPARHSHVHAHPYGVSSSRASSVGPSASGTATPVAIPDGAHACKWRGCRLRFGSSAELMAHLSLSHVGSGKASYVCEWEGCDRCEDGKGFAQRQKVMRHLQTHTGDRPFVCETCGKSFSEQMTLTQHRRVHTHERPYKCTFEGCDKAFSLASALTIHQRTHTGDKPFLCPVEGCSAAFAESSNLSKHVRTHRGEKSYGCEECGKKFARSDQLARHRKIHERDRIREEGAMVAVEA